MNDDNVTIAVFVVGLLLGAAAATYIAVEAHEDSSHRVAIEYGIGGFNQQTGEFEYYEERKCK